MIICAVRGLLIIAAFAFMVPARAKDGDIVDATRLLEAAKSLKSEGRLGEAIEALDRARQVDDGAEVKLLRAECVVLLARRYIPSAADPADSGRSVRLPPRTREEERNAAIPLVVSGEPVRDRRTDDWQSFEEVFESIEDCRDVILSSPNETRAYKLLAILLTFTLDAREQMTPPSPQATFSIAPPILTDRGHPNRETSDRREQAVAALTEGLRIDPKNLELRLARINAYGCMGRFDEAWLDVERAQETDYGDPRIIIERSQLKRLRKDLDGALFEAEFAVRRGPENPFAWAQLADLEVDRKRWKEAAEHITKCLELVEGRVDDPILCKSRWLLGRSICYANLSRPEKERAGFERALQDVNEAIELFPENPKLYFHRASVHYNLGDLARCREDCERAVRLRPYCQQYRKYLAQALRELGRIDEAAEQERLAKWIGGWEFLRGLARKVPDQWTLALASHVRKGGLTRESLAYYDQAVESLSDPAPALAGRAEARLELGDTDAALADATRAAEAGSKEGLSVRGDVYLALGRFDEAIADYEAAGEFGEKVARAYRGRAAEHQAAARAAEAEEDLKRAEQFDPLGTARAEEDAAKR